MRYVDLASALQTRRVVSIDALRGLSIFCIIGLDGTIWALAEMSAGKGPVVSAAGKLSRRPIYPRGLGGSSLL